MNTHACPAVAPFMTCFWRSVGFLEKNSTIGGEATSVCLVRGNPRAVFDKRCEAESDRLRDVLTVKETDVMNTELANKFLEESVQQVDEPVTDPDEERLIEPAVCPICFAVFQHGRWQWAARWPMDARQKICPACQWFSR